MEETARIIAGLRIDVDTFRGTDVGVPALCSTLARHNILASFFFSVGPDNMGRHLWRLLRPAFLLKMLRSRAASLYGWDILLRGTFWPGPLIGERLAPAIRAAAAAGHEIGLHAWDHHAWQSRIDRMNRAEIGMELQTGFDALSRIIGAHPVCSAVPGWKCNDLVLQKKETFPFRFNSDCRGENIFLPVTGDGKCHQPQIPVTLPTYDELIGRGGLTDANYNRHLLSLMKPDRLNVLTIHAEVEGGSRHALFVDFLDMAAEARVRFQPLGTLIGDSATLPRCRIEQKEFPGREGWIACQDNQDGGAGSFR